MTKSPRKNVPDVGIELGAGCMPSGHASDRATAPGIADLEVKLLFSEAIKSIQSLVLNTGSYVNGCVKMIILSFCQTSNSAKHKLELFCSHK